MGKPNFPSIKVAYKITDANGNAVKRGVYRLDDDTERRAFGQRCHEAMRDGYVIHTCRNDLSEALA